MSGPEKASPPCVGSVPAAHIAHGVQTLHQFHDDQYGPMRSRIRAISKEHEIDGDALIPMATMTRASEGGPLRTFSGGLAHENGWIPGGEKAKRLLHWQGVAQRALIVRSISDFEITRVATESIRLDFSDGFEKYEHTIDVELTRAGGPLLAIEMKRDENDLRDAHLRRKLAGAHEIYRRCGIDFVVMFRNEVFRDRHHRRNAELFAARQFFRIERTHLKRLEAHAFKHGPQTTYGALAETLEPLSRTHGEALVQALTVRRRVEIDITARLTRNTELRIH